MKLDITLPLSGLIVYPAEWVIADEAIISGRAVYVDPLAYRMLQRGDSFADVFQTHTFRVLPSMAHGWLFDQIRITQHERVHTVEGGPAGP